MWGEDYSYRLHIGEHSTPGITHNVVFPLPSVAPNTGFTSAGVPESAMWGWEAVEDHIIPMLPNVPADQKNEAIIMLWRNRSRARQCPQLQHITMYTLLFHLCFTILPTCGPSLWWGQCIIDTVVCIYRAGGGFCKQAKVTSRYGTKCGILPVPIFNFFPPIFS